MRKISLERTTENVSNFVSRALIKTITILLKLNPTVVGTQHDKPWGCAFSCEEQIWENICF